MTEQNEDENDDEYGEEKGEYGEEKSEYDEGEEGETIALNKSIDFSHALV